MDDSNSSSASTTSPAPYALIALIAALVVLRAAASARGLWKLVMPASVQPEPSVACRDGDCTLLSLARSRVALV
jgi:hypothetical protein